MNTPPMRERYHTPTLRRLTSEEVKERIAKLTADELIRDMQELDVRASKAVEAGDYEALIAVAVTVRMYTDAVVAMARRELDARQLRGAT